MATLAASKEKTQKKFDTLDKITKQVKNGELPLEKAYEDVTSKTGYKKSRSRSRKIRFIIPKDGEWQGFYGRHARWQSNGLKKRHQSRA